MNFKSITIAIILLFVSQCVGQTRTIYGECDAIYNPNADPVTVVIGNYNTVTFGFNLDSLFTWYDQYKAWCADSIQHESGLQICTVDTINGVTIDEDGVKFYQRMICRPDYYFAPREFPSFEGFMQWLDKKRKKI